MTTSADVFAIELGEHRYEFGDGRVRALDDALRVRGLGGEVGLLTSAGARSRGVVETISEVLDERSLTVMTGDFGHVPQDQVRLAGKRLSGCDTLVCVGGGSAIGVTKAIAAATGAALVALPTTFSGSEVTGYYGITDAHRKTVRWASQARPTLVLYDPTLAASLSRRMAAASLLNALAHVLDAPAGGEMLDRAGIETAVALILAAAQQLTAESAADGRLLSLAGFMGGLCLERRGFGVHHAICHAVGGALRVPHAEIHSVLLGAFAVHGRSALAPQSSDAAMEALHLLQTAYRAAGGPLSLGELGATPQDVDEIVESAFREMETLAPGEAIARTDVIAIVTEAISGGVNTQPVR